MCGLVVISVFDYYLPLRVYCIQHRCPLDEIDCHSQFCLLITKTVPLYRILQENRHLLDRNRRSSHEIFVSRQWIDELSTTELDIIKNSYYSDLGNRFTPHFPSSPITTAFDSIELKHLFHSLSSRRFLLSKCSINWFKCKHCLCHRRRSFSVPTVTHRRIIIGFHTVRLKRCTHTGCRTTRNCQWQRNFNFMPSNRLNVCTASIRVFSAMWKCITRQLTKICHSLWNVSEMLNNVRCAFTAVQIWPIISSKCMRHTQHPMLLCSIRFALQPSFSLKCCRMIFINDSSAVIVVQHLKLIMKPNGIVVNGTEIWRMAQWCSRQLLQIALCMLFAAFVVLKSNRPICWITCWRRAKRWATVSMSCTATIWKRKWCSTMDLWSSRQMWRVPCMMTASKSCSYFKTATEAWIGPNTKQRTIQIFGGKKWILEFQF